MSSRFSLPPVLLVLAVMDGGIHTASGTERDFGIPSHGLPCSRNENGSTALGQSMKASFFYSLTLPVSSFPTSLSAVHVAFSAFPLLDLPGYDDDS